MAPQIRLTDVTLRDGLQDEARTVPTASKVDLALGLLDAGFRSLEVGAFVRPDRVPQLADTAEVLARLPRRDGTCLSVLAFTPGGARRALDAGADEIRLVVSASQAHSTANAGASIDVALRRLEDAARVVTAARHPPRLVGAIAAAFLCPVDGPTPTGTLAAIATRLRAAGVERLSLADTLGAAGPPAVAAGVRTVREAAPGVSIGLHLHDTYGRALANAWVGYEAGVVDFDAALGGLGGCPFMPGAAGNVAAEDLLGLMDSAGLTTGIDAGALLGLLPSLAALVGHPVGSRVSRAPAPVPAATPVADDGGLSPASGTSS
ncbi:MAG: hydroxymethylglutaryl-CoA lyase [Actinomycetes bacterium]